MVQVIQAQTLNLIDLEEKFGLRLADDDQFFGEWLNELPELTELERQLLDRVKDNYLSLVKRRPMAEDMVKMVVLSPLLDLAGFYRSPFYVQTETSVDIVVEDQEEIVRGRIDVLVLQQQFWLLVIESKNAGFSLVEAIPQALAYMLANPHPQKPAFGLVTNGSEFVFLKLVKQDPPQYALSDQFTLLKRESELHYVLRVLKKLAQILS
jgi:hypothetical protein